MFLTNPIADVSGVTWSRGGSCSFWGESSNLALGGSGISLSDSGVALGGSGVVQGQWCLTLTKSIPPRVTSVFWLPSKGHISLNDHFWVYYYY